MAYTQEQLDILNAAKNQVVAISVSEDKNFTQTEIENKLTKVQQEIDALQAQIQSKRAERLTLKDRLALVQAKILNIN